MIPLTKIVTLFSLWSAPPSEKRRLEGTPSLPLPIDPPSDSFCKSNELGSDYYYTVFEPCVFTFYNSTSAVDDGNTCDDIDPSFIVKTEKRFVKMWPESCVASGPRCYSLASNPELAKFTSFKLDGDKDKVTPFPAGAMSVNVTCASDYSKARQFADDLENNVTTILLPFILATVLFFVVGLLICCGGIYCCCCCGSTKTEYVPVSVV